jgi:hypothetical protein
MLSLQVTKSPNLNSKGKVSNRTHRIADNGSYIEPPELQFLQNSTYGIQPVVRLPVPHSPTLRELRSSLVMSQSVTASSLHSYEAQGLNYNLSDISLLVNDSLSGNLSDQFFLQGVSSQGSKSPTLQASATAANYSIPQQEYGHFPSAMLETAATGWQTTQRK